MSSGGCTGDTGATNERWVALCGGIGGAKLALGLARVLPPEALTIVVNTGDDFRHLGLHVSPDIDTVLYTLAGMSNRELGWGLEGETWSFMDGLARLGGPTWFRLGDKDLATHAVRTTMLSEGRTLSDVTDHLRLHLGIGPTVVPMSDQPVATVIETDEGMLAFQTYFVGRKAEPRIRAIHFDGAAAADPAPAARAALDHPDLAGIIVCPSNPWLSIDPILAVPGWRACMTHRRVPCVAVTPLVGGLAIKGPTAKIMAELGLPLDVAAIVAHYAGLIDGLVLDTVDADRAGALPIATHVTNTIMRTLEDRMALGREALGFCRRLRQRTPETDA
ncbi:MAG: 2-phospho-L-lactate transferase [Hyphomicrobiaceae bacterium]|nr:2-phospho-L-lactate transferase [Hyphomicrobiaceae bacterium]